MALEGRLQIRSTDPGVIGEAVTRLVAPCRPEKRPDQQVIDFTGDFIGWHEFAMGESATESGLSLVTEHRRPVILCTVTVDGRLTYERNGNALTAGPGEAVLCDARLVDKATFSARHSQYLVTTPVAALARHMSDRHGVRLPEGVDIATTLRRDAATSIALRGFIPVINELFQDRDLQQISPAKTRRCREAFLDLMSVALIDAGIVVAEREDDRAASRHVREAEAYMRAHCHLGIGVSDVAAAQGISTRSLQQAFRQHADTTPLARLSALRLAAYRSALEADPRVDWRTLASRWGFTNRSRFARQYAEMFGEPPSATARQMRGK